jgi:AraC-like DNA-binding protein
VSVTLVRAIVEEVARSGASADDVLRAADLDPGLLDDPNARVDLAAYHALQARAIAVTGDAALGLHMAERTSLSSFHMVGALAMHCRTIRHAIELLRRYRKLLSDVEPPELVEEEDAAFLTVGFLKSGTPDTRRLSAEFGVAAMLRIARMVLGASLTPRFVEFAHPAPGHAREYERVLGCPVIFDGPATCIAFDRIILDARGFHANAELLRLLTSQAERKLAGLVSTSLAARVRVLVSELYQERGEKPQASVIARRLGMSARTLRRHLQDEGCSPAEVVEAAMADVARALLAEPGATIQDVADRLGFSEPSAFHRAFKRWTGLTPGQARTSPGT